MDGSRQRMFDRSRPLHYGALVDGVRVDPVSDRQGISAEGPISLG